MIDDYNITSTGDDRSVHTFPAGTRNGEILNASLTIQDDFLVEVTETVVLYASTQPELSASFAPGQNSVTVSILDDDGKQAGTVTEDYLYVLIPCCCCCLHRYGDNCKQAREAITLQKNELLL